MRYSKMIQLSSTFIVISLALAGCAISDDMSAEDSFDDLAELQLQAEEASTTEEASVTDEETGDIVVEAIEELYPQETAEYSTFWFVRTDWKVYNPHAQPVQVRVSCDRYGYDYTYWVPPNDDVADGWGCEGRTLYIKNMAPQNSNLFVHPTVW